MVQLKSETSVSRLTLEWEREPLGRENEYWVHRAVHKYRPTSKMREGCVPLADWQTSHNPSCNLFHELDMTDFFHPHGHELIRLINGGAYRDVWGIRDTINSERRVLKTLRWAKTRDFDPRNFDRHRRDAVALEQIVSPARGGHLRLLLQLGLV